MKAHYTTKKALSITLVNKFYNNAKIRFGTHSVVDSERESIADFVRRVRREKDYSLAKVREQSGGNIAPSYLHKIESGDVKNVSPEKLSALAKGLGIPEDEIFAVARGKGEADPSTEHEKQELITYYDDLPRECQKDVLALTKALWVRRNLEGRAERRLQRRAGVRPVPAVALGEGETSDMPTITGTYIQGRAPRDQFPEDADLDELVRPTKTLNTSPPKKRRTG